MGDREIKWGLHIPNKWLCSHKKKMEVYANEWYSQNEKIINFKNKWDCK